MILFGEQCLCCPLISARIHVFTLFIHNQDRETFPYGFLYLRFVNFGDFSEKEETEGGLCPFFGFRWFYVEGSIVNGSNFT